MVRPPPWQAFEKAEKNKEWLIGYFYEPQYIHAEIDLERVKLPPYKEGCDADKAKVACDYAETTMKKVASTKFLDSDSSAADLVKNLKWTNDDQNLVAKYITADKMSAGGCRGQVGRGQQGQGRRLAQADRPQHRRFGAPHLDMCGALTDSRIVPYHASRCA